MAEASAPQRLHVLIPHVLTCQGGVRAQGLRAVARANIDRGNYIEGHEVMEEDMVERSEGI